MLAGYALKKDSLSRAGDVFQAIRDQLPENAASCGVMGSTNKGISLCIDRPSDSWTSGREHGSWYSPPHLHVH